VIVLENRRVILVSCPNKECKKPFKIKANINHFVWKSCDNCGKEFFVNPRNKQMQKNLMAVDKHPDRYVLIHRSDLDDILDAMLLLKDIDGCKEIAQLKALYPDVEWFVRKNHENKLYPLALAKQLEKEEGTE
jgi:hypothetical protein